MQARARDRVALWRARVNKVPRPRQLVLTWPALPLVGQPARRIGQLSVQGRGQTRLKSPDGFGIDISGLTKAAALTYADQGVRIII